MSIRVRYAPSPTGLQHIGGVRTALFNYFLAKATGGVFYLRIEDTDQTRYDERAVEDIYDTFSWLGIQLDEGPREGGPYGPYVQSQRLAYYKDSAEKLLASGYAYRCFCTSEDLEKMRAEQAAKGLPGGYDRRCRHLDPNQSETRAKAGERNVIRFKVPLEGETKVKDVLLGDVSWPNKDINPDPVMLKADGFPTYHLAHAVDDSMMKTTHVLRGQEWLPSAPLHVLIFGALGLTVPLYCHLSTIMGSDGQKLSKRHGSTSAQEFRLGGYVADAVINYITLLGWSYDGSTELFSKAELEKLFTLEKLSKSPATFDYQKLDWFNGHYIRKKSDEELANLITPFLTAKGLIAATGPVDDKERSLVRSAIGIARERLHKLSDAPDVLGFLFRAPALDDPQIFIPKKQTATEVAVTLESLLPELATFDTRNDEQNEQHFHNFAEERGLKLGNVLMPLRLAVTGTSASPPLMPSIRLLGSREATKRVRDTANLLQKL